MYDKSLGFPDQGQKNHSLVPLHGSMAWWKADGGSRSVDGIGQVQNACHAHISCHCPQSLQRKQSLVTLW